MSMGFKVSKCHPHIQHLHIYCVHILTHICVLVSKLKPSLPPSPVCHFNVWWCLMAT